VCLVARRAAAQRPSGGPWNCLGLGIPGWRGRSVPLMEEPVEESPQTPLCDQRSWRGRDRGGSRSRAHACHIVAA
ncbi:unnamed protein product, partial [Polarella glacialis]